MRIACVQCRAVFSIDDSLIPVGGIKAQCPACGQITVIRNAKTDVHKEEIVVSNPPAATGIPVVRANDDVLREFQKSGVTSAPGQGIGAAGAQLLEDHCVKCNKVIVGTRNSSIKGVGGLCAQCLEGERQKVTPIVSTAASPVKVRPVPEWHNPPPPPSRLVRNLMLGVLLVILAGGAIWYFVIRGSFNSQEKDILQEAVGRFAKEIRPATGNSVESVAAGKKLFYRDDRLSFLQADELFKGAIILDSGNVDAIAGWIQNRALLDMGRWHETDVKMVQELLDSQITKAPDQPLLLRAKAYLSFSRGNVTEAREQAVRVLEQMKDDPETQVILGASYVESNTSLAVEWINKAIKSNPELLLGYRFLGEAYLHAGRFHEALRLFDLRLEKDPGHYDILEAKARVYLATGRFDKAKDMFEMILGAEPQRVQTAATLARISTQVMEQPQETEKMLKHFFVSNVEMAANDWATILTEKSVALRLQGKGVEAVEMANQALRYNPSYLPALYARAVGEQDAGNIGLALVHLRELRSKRPNAARVAARIADIESQIASVRDAEKDYVQAVELDPKDLDIVLMAATHSLLTGDLNKGYSWLRKATMLDPFYPEAHRSLVDFYDESILTATVQRLGQALTKFERDPLAQTLAGMVYFRVGQLDQARSRLKLSLDLDPEVQSTHLAFGLLELAQDHLDEAVSALERAHQIDARHRNGANLLAQAFLRQKRYDKAQALFDSILQLDSGDSQARIGLAQVQMHTKHKNKAVASLQQLYLEDRDNLEVKRLLFQLGQ